MDGYVLPPSGIVTATEAAPVLSDLLELMVRPAWMADALCREYPEVDFVPDRSRVQWERARETCRSCLVSKECLAYALADPTLVAIWGGTDEGERRRMRRTRQAADRNEPAA